ncbi:proteasome inhibitor PI31 subunit isoform X2 [Anolis sagrei]|uniref:proteasome inhibitor PI31 subunit isoform X2 n=1 Tax=Anolis sagrei TaxID=38937 RepID=UPI0035216F2E
MAGLELLFSSVSPDLSCPQDALVCYLHWKLISHGYRCLGTGDQPGANERKSEMLPPGWNADKELYTMRYRAKDDSRDLLLKGIMVDGSIILNVMEPKSQKVADLTLKVTDYVNPGHLADFDKQDPMGPFAVGGEDLDPFGGRSGGMIFDPLRSGYRNPGIDPSSGLPTRLPPGSVPPGARFDPFGPPGANRSGPNPDHLPPPNYDDMFM